MKCIDKVIENMCNSINNDFENNRVTEDTFVMINSLSTLVESKKETAQEVKFQEQLLKINRNIKFTKFSVIICSLFTIIGLNLLFYRFNESIQGIIDILNNNVSITGTILDILQTITNVFVNF